MRIVSLMVIRDEEDYIDYNIRYHLDIGFDLIAILDHCSDAPTKDVLSRYRNNERVFILEETNPVFDHARLANKLLSAVKCEYQFDWAFVLDADEFLGIESDIHSFIYKIQSMGIVYGSIPWVNALVDSNSRAKDPIDVNLFYLPWPERSWQHEGHFRKSFAKNHDGIATVVGGHYFRSQNNADFLADSGGEPRILTKEDARLFHFEFRSSPRALMNKWQKLAQFEIDSSSSVDAPWMERIALIRSYVGEFGEDIESVDQRWFQEHRTLWGTPIPPERLLNDRTLQNWLNRFDISNPA